MSGGDINVYKVMIYIYRAINSFTTAVNLVRYHPKVVE